MERTKHYYIYALDTADGSMTAALSCPDEKTAKQAFLIASREMKMEHSTDGFRFGHTYIDSQTGRNSAVLIRKLVAISRALPSISNGFPINRLHCIVISNPTLPIVRVI